MRAADEEVPMDNPTGAVGRGSKNSVSRSEPEPESSAEETYNPWTVVHLVFEHLADAGLHPVLGATGHPGEPAAELLRCLGIQPDLQGDQRIVQQKSERLAELRQAMFGEA
jgi:hypothetical protein